APSIPGGPFPSARPVQPTISDPDLLRCDRGLTSCPRGECRPEEPAGRNAGEQGEGGGPDHQRDPCLDGQGRDDGSRSPCKDEVRTRRSTHGPGDPESNGYVLITRIRAIVHCGAGRLAEGVESPPFNRRWSLSIATSASLLSRRLMSFITLGILTSWHHSQT